MASFPTRQAQGRLRDRSLWTAAFREFHLEGVRTRGEFRTLLSVRKSPKDESLGSHGRGLRRDVFSLSAGRMRLRTWRPAPSRSVARSKPGKHPRQRRPHLSQRGRPDEQAEAVELGERFAECRNDQRPAVQCGRVRQSRNRPAEQRKILVPQVSMHPQVGKHVRRDREACFLAQLANGRTAKVLAWFGETLGDIPARRACRMTQQDASAIGDQHATTRPPCRLHAVTPLSVQRSAGPCCS